MVYAKNAFIPIAEDNTIGYPATRPIIIVHKALAIAVAAKTPVESIPASLKIDELTGRI